MRRASPAFPEPELPGGVDATLPSACPAIRSGIDLRPRLGQAEGPKGQNRVTFLPARPHDAASAACTPELLRRTSHWSPLYTPRLPAQRVGQTVRASYFLLHLSCLATYTRHG